MAIKISADDLSDLQSHTLAWGLLSIGGLKRQTNPM